MTDNIGQEDQIKEENQHGRYLTFHLGEEVFAVETKYVTEIVGMQLITSVPEAPSYIKGIVNLRGVIIPAIDGRLKFGIESVDYDERTSIIVISIDAVSFGLIVDGVEDMLTINDDEIAPPPSKITGFTNHYIKGFGKAEGKIQLLLDCESLLKSGEMQVVEELFEEVG